MKPEYLKKVTVFEIEEKVEYFGVFNPVGELVAYAHVMYLDQAAFIFKILWHNDNLKDGIIYLLINKLIEILYHKKIAFPSLEYIIYDSFFTNSKGLALFKKRAGFLPTLVKWYLRK